MFHGGFVAVTVGFAALGAYLGRDLSGATGLLIIYAVAGLVIFGGASTGETPAPVEARCVR